MDARSNKRRVKKIYLIENENVSDVEREEPKMLSKSPKKIAHKQDDDYVYMSESDESIEEEEELINEKELSNSDEESNMYNISSSVTGLPENVKIIGDVENIANLISKVKPNIPNKSIRFKDKTRSFIISKSDTDSIRDEQEEKEKIYDEYFQIGMSRRTLVRKRKRDDDSDELDVSELLKGLKLTSSLTNADSMFNILSQYYTTSIENNEAVQSLFNSWSQLWDNTHIGSGSNNYKITTNILVAGYGSKLELLTKFIKSYIHMNSTLFVFILAGYDPTTTIRGLLFQLLSSLDPNAHVNKHITNNELIERIHRNLDSRTIYYPQPTKEPSFFLRSLRETNFVQTAPLNSEVYICVHNLDSAQLQSTQNQKCLATLFSHPQIHLIASVDNPMASLMWDSATLSLYNFQYFWVKGFVAPYLYESIYSNKYKECVSTALARSKESKIKGLENILKSFGHQHVKTFQTLVSMLHNAQQEENVKGFTLEDICAEIQKNTRGFVNEKTIKSHLTKMQGNDLLTCDIVRGKSLYCLTRQYQKILADIFELCNRFNMPPDAKQSRVD